MINPNLQIVICSTRPRRVGPSIASWAHDAARRHGKLQATLVDIGTFNLPVFDEPEHPRLQKYEHDHTKKWSASVSAADAFVFVIPEYNYSPPPAFLNAMTYLSREWHYKPAAFVSYGGVSGGLRAVQVAKQMLTTFKMVPLLEAVVIPQVTQHLNSEGRFAPTELHESSAMVMLEELHRWTLALRPLRAS